MCCIFYQCSEVLLQGRELSLAEMMLWGGAYFLSSALEGKTQRVTFVHCLSVAVYVAKKTRLHFPILSHPFRVYTTIMHSVDFLYKLMSPLAAILKKQENLVYLYKLEHIKNSV